MWPRRSTTSTFLSSWDAIRSASTAPVNPAPAMIQSCLLKKTNRGCCGRKEPRFGEISNPPLGGSTICEANFGEGKSSRPTPSRKTLCVFRPSLKGRVGLLIQHIPHRHADDVFVAVAGRGVVDRCGRIEVARIVVEIVLIADRTHEHVRDEVIVE